ncbi:MAG: universal stress protein [Gordonibacter sp.]|nr:universal stress protein [Gordonibacter sp.]
MRFSNILVPFDKSEHAVHALEMARGLAEEDREICLHVVDVLYVSEIPPSLGLDANPYESIPPLAVDPDLYEKLVDAALAREKDDMSKTIGTLLDGLPNTVHIVAVNAASIVDGINDYAQDHDCDLIIMGSRGLGLLRGMLGSVSYGVLRSSEIPVLIAKTPDKK